MYPSKLTTEKVVTSINLVSKDDETNSLVLNNEALNLIRDLNGNVAICVCIGQYRSGKSFLLNTLFKYFTNVPYNTFEVGHYETGCTKGCWINREIPVLKASKRADETYLIFVDTEGIESEDSSEEWDTKLFLFSLLISSLFIYNTKNNLAANDFKKLAVMTHLSSKLSLKSGSSRAFNEKFLRNEGPGFICIVRDFSFKEKLTAKKSLEQFLELEAIQTRPQTTNDKKSKEMLEDKLKRNEIRRNMVNSFKSFDCFRLPEPVSDQTIKGMDKEEALQSLDSIKYEELRDKFRNKFDEMCEDLKLKLKPKCLKETNLNGFQLAEFLKIIVDLINKDKAICLHDTVVTAITREAHFRVNKYIDEYQRKMNELSLPIQSDEMEKIDEEIIRLSLIKLHKSLEANPLLLEDLKKKLYEKRNAKYTEIFKRNQEKINEFNEQKVNNLWKNDKHKLDSIQTVNEFQTILDDFKSKFTTQEQFEKNKPIADEFWREFEHSIGKERIREDLIEKVSRIEIEKLKRQFKNGTSGGVRQTRQDSFQYREDYISDESNDSFDDDSNRVGRYVSNGRADGETVYEGERGGLYRETEAGNIIYIKESQVDFDSD